MSELYKAIFKACLDSANALGPDIKNISWLGKNHTASMQPVGTAAYTQAQIDKAAGVRVSVPTTNTKGTEE